MREAIVQVRVVVVGHPLYRRTGTVALADFEKAAGRRSRGSFTATFSDGPHLVRFREVEVVAIADEHPAGSTQQPGGAS